MSCFIDYFMLKFVLNEFIMKHIILPTDFSKNAINACAYALKLFKNERCTFHLVHSYAPMKKTSVRISNSFENLEVSSNTNQVKSQNNLLKFIADLRKISGKPWHFFKPVSSPKLLVVALRELIENTDAELIIMGTKGASGLKEIFMGSTTVHVIKSIKSCPIMAIPENFGFESPLEIAFATDLFRFYSQAELAPVLNLAKIFKSTIRIVNVAEKEQPLSEIQNFNLSIIKKYFKDVPNYLCRTSFQQSISRTLELFTEELDIHLLALLNYQHGYLERVRRESIVKKIAFHTTIPLLIIPELSLNIRSKKNKSQTLISIA